MGGTSEAHLNVTYNYSTQLHRHLDADNGLRWLYGKTGGDTIEKLDAAVKALGVARHNDYWKATDGNAGFALSILLAWARQHPAAIWGGD